MTVNPDRPTRRQRAQETRRRMLDAAQVRFIEHGFAGARMADVAADAGVAVQTVYFTFHTKINLLDACIARAVMGEDEPLPPQEQPFWAAMLEAPSGAAAVHHFVGGVGAILRRVAQLDQVVSAATHDPDAAAIWTRGEALRRSGFREAVGYIDGRFGLRDGLDAERATDILLVMGGHAVYCALVHESGWSHDDFVAWLADAVAELLLPG